ncbi:MAG: Wzz/FepE/Etk N-terminal domain-containing protein [Candidatus Marinamargulisbacteria bacterium]
MTQPPPAAYIDDEIDLMPYIKHVVSHWRLFLVAMVTGVIIASLLAMTLPKKYTAQTTFLLPESSTVMGGGSSLLASFGFSSMASGGTSGVYSGYLMPIFNSMRIKHHVAGQFLDHPMFLSDAHFQALPEDQKIPYIIGTLKFSKAVTFEQDAKDPTYKMAYTHRDPAIILPVINAYFNALVALNDELNVDSDVLQMIPLDEAVQPTSHSFPNTQLFLIVGLALGFFTAFLGVLGQKVVGDLRGRDA